ncbi:unnamed protein product [Thlaspi arvense]|uniref:Uncharacterized protein n=1 Tax=Thlaspi arvense TaxID=13288 RepID=A0AAU9RSE6_THLAR|nr:unnamed protein product [Thlaspi arvense]
MVPFFNNFVMHSKTPRDGNSEFSGSAMANLQMKLRKKQHGVKPTTTWVLLAILFVLLQEKWSMKDLRFAWCVLAVFAD